MLATNIVNLDKTNLSDDLGFSKYILFRHDVTYPERKSNTTKGNISLMFIVSAGSRHCLNLYVIYKATKL